MRILEFAGSCLLVLLLATVVVPAAPLDAQQAPRQARQAAPAWDTNRAKNARPARVDSSPGPQLVVTESEPNDEPGNANPAALGDTVAGMIGVSGDIDMFALDLVEGTFVDLDVDAYVLGSYMDAELYLLDAGGQVIAYNDDSGSLDSRIRAEIPLSGRYFVAILDYWGDSGSDFTYRIRLGEMEPGPGDPTTTRPSGADGAWTIAAGATGEIYVLDWFDGDIWRAPRNSGSPTLVARTDGYDMVLDAFGDLLVVQPDSGNIVRVATANGARTRFASLPGYLPISITVGPDGDVWTFALGEEGGSRLFRYTPYGAQRQIIDAAELYFALKMAFSPAGVLHLSDGAESIYRLNANGTFTLVFQSSDGVGGMSFDTDGNMYVSTPYGGIVKLDASYAVVRDPFALSNLALSGNTAFLRDANGAMTSRLVASNLQGAPGGLLVEMNPAGMTATGARVGIDLERVTVTLSQASEHVLGGTALGAEAAALVDGQGNGNGQVDVGDLRALVRAQATTTPSETEN